MTLDHIRSHFAFKYKMKQLRESGREFGRCVRLNNAVGNTSAEELSD